MTLQHLRSSTANKRPDPTAMADGQIALNTAAASPGLFYKDSAGNLVKVGPVHVGATAPNASPASGGTAGNSVGEQWLDTTGGTYVFKVWDGSAWRSETGTFVDVNGDVMTGALGIIAGTAGSPGLYISGDTNTGIYSPGADQLALSTNGTGRLFVDASGRVGIGTSTPSEGFQVVSSTGYSTLNSIRIGSDGNNDIYKGSGALTISTSDALLFKTGPLTERLRITSAGLVGVGTSTPDGRITVQRASNNQGISSGIAFKGQDGTTHGGVGTDGVNTNNLQILAAQGIYFHTGNTDGTTNIRATLDSSGRLGIGTSSPSNRLVVSNSGAEGFEFIPAQTSNRNMLLSYNRSGSNYSQLALAASDFRFNNGGSDIVAITSTGQVGIGSTSDPGGYGAKLWVDNTTNSTLTINTTGSASLSQLVFRNSNSNGEARLVNGTSGPLTFHNGNGNEAARIDTSSRLLVGTSTSTSVSAVAEAGFQIRAANPSGCSASFIHSSANANSHAVVLAKVRGSSVVENGDNLGSISWQGFDGAVFARAAEIKAEVDGTPGANDMPGRLVFSTTADGASSPTERLRIDSSGRVGIGTSSPSSNLHVASTGSAAAAFITSDISTSALASRIALGNSVGTARFTLGLLGGGGEAAYLGPEGNFPLYFQTNGTERARIDSSGRLLVGTSSTSATCTAVFSKRSDGAADPIVRLEVNSTSPANGTALGGINFASSGLSGFQAGARIVAVRDGGTWTNGSSHPTYLEFSTTADGASSPTERMRIRSDGAILAGSSGDGTWHGSVFSRLTGNVNRGFLFVNTGSGIGPLPCEANGTTTDNTTIFGFSSARWSVIYAATGTINTSDLNEKQDVHDLSAAELAVAQELKTLLKTFRWKEAVRQKGDDARIHVGVMAQDVEAAFQRHGLDATRYALWCKDTWYEVDGKSAADDGNFYTAESPGAVERTRLGIRYDQLLAFVLAAL